MLLFSPLLHCPRSLTFPSSLLGIFKNQNRIAITSRLEMVDHDNLNSKVKKSATFRLCKVSSRTTELLEVVSDRPTLQVLVIPGSPGLVPFYKEFVESLYGFLGGTASVTAIGHLSHTTKNWEQGKMFSLNEQIEHKVDFIKQELQSNDAPIVLVGHSIGSYMSIGALRKSTEKVIYCIGLYPFLMVNQQSRKQFYIEKISRSWTLSSLVSFSMAALGFFPEFSRRLLVSSTMGRTWSDTAIHAASNYLFKFYIFRNMLFLAKTEFIMLTEEPDWEFMRQNHDKLAFLYGTDDHWAPLQMFTEILKQLPDIVISVEREGHEHTFSCTGAGSTWVARHVSILIKNRLSRLNI